MADTDRPGEEQNDAIPADGEKAQGQAKPIGQWNQFDFLAAGVNVVRSNAQTRTVNTATGTPGLQRTGLRIRTTFDKGFKFAK